MTTMAASSLLTTVTTSMVVCLSLMLLFITGTLSIHEASAAAAVDTTRGRPMETSGGSNCTGARDNSVIGNRNCSKGMCEALNMVTINCHVETLERTTKSKPLVTVEDLKVWYPAQFNTVGKFKEPAKIILKHDVEPHIDRPWKCNINLKPKIEVELKKMEEMSIIRKVKEHQLVFKHCVQYEA
ncbi:hypothetical protein LSAT2_003648 [Lamellibrachia satsuma]|nr:hypothetical protein LSAT2_003648 [Lamellibrachia satsuma]